MKNENKTSPVAFFGRVIFLASAGYVIWQNRFKIQRFLEAQGIRTPWMTGDAGEAILSGAAKAAGKVEKEIGTFSASPAFSKTAGE
jgi:hypothetical protein